jgi:hypothetical protein
MGDSALGCFQSPGVLMCHHGKQIWQSEEYWLFQTGMHDREEVTSLVRVLQADDGLQRINFIERYRGEYGQVRCNADIRPIS